MRGTVDTEHIHIARVVTFMSRCENISEIRNVGTIVKNVRLRLLIRVWTDIGNFEII